MKSTVFEYLTTTSGRANFERICIEELTSAQTVYLGGVGTLGEKRLHRVIKRAITEDSAAYEVKAEALCDGCRGIRFVADVFSGNEIFEIQTGSLRPLVKKLQWYMENTPYDVTVVHPIPAERRISWIDPETGEVGKPRKSIKKGKPSDIAGELYWIKQFISDPCIRGRFRLVLPMLSVTDYRIKNGWSADGKKGSEKYERIPASVCDVIELESIEDYRKLLIPDNFDGMFTATQYAKATGIRGMTTYSVIHFLEETGVIVKAGKAGRSVSYMQIR